MGKFEKYNDQEEIWESYLERFEMYVLANDIAVEKKKAYLLSLMGSKTYNLLKNLAAPTSPADLTFDQIKTKLKDHLSPKPSKIAERFRFQKCDQNHTETINDYVVRLKLFSKNCDYGDSLKDALLDRFVAGIRNAETQRRLLIQPDTLTYDEAVKMSVAMEMAAKDATELSHTDTMDINFLSKREHMNYPSKKGGPNKDCSSCGRKHGGKCRFSDATCYNCKQIGHIARICRKVKKSVHKLTDTESRSKEYDEVYTLTNSLGGDEELELACLNCITTPENSGGNSSSAGGNKPSAIMMNPTIEGRTISMELDTGSAFTIIPRSIYEKHLQHCKLHTSHVVFKSYTGHKVTCIGETEVKVSLDGTDAMMKIHVVDVEGPALMGREWLARFNLNWRDIKHFTTVGSSEQKLADLLKQHREVFSTGLGKLKNEKAHLTLKENAIPRFMKPYPVAYAKRVAVDAELERLQKAGVLIPVDYSEWATPVVAVEKSDGGIRLCGNFKCTLNQCLEVDTYPMPVIQDVFDKLAGGTKFTEIDLAHAYQQVEMDEESQKLLVINTHKGLFMNTRLLQGLSPASAIFQKKVDQSIQGIDSTVAWVDNIIITGKTDDEHLRNIKSVLERLENRGFKVKPSKCKFMQPRIKVLGFEVSSDGIKTCDDKISAMISAPVPDNRTKLRSFLGLVNYYGRFLKNLSTTLHPLNELLSTKKGYKWDKECEKSFKQLKVMLASTEVLTYYDPEKPVRIEADASPYGIGAVISHVMEDGSHRPIAYASRTLNISERNYAQIDKEALALVFAVEKFHYFVFGRNFTLVTDHKPLKYLLGPYTGIPHMAASRMQRWAIKMMKYNYIIEYRNTKEHANADFLSRLPCSTIAESSDDPVSIFVLKQIEALPVTADEIRKHTSRDGNLSLVVEIVVDGYTPENFIGENAGLKPYLNRLNEMSFEQGCILWGNRVVIPAALQKRVLEELHEGHCGIVAMKGLARSFIWWPGLDEAIENMATSCRQCLWVQNNPSKAPLHLWEWPSKRWERLHIDYAGPYKGWMYLILIDAYSKWPEVVLRKLITSESTINALRTIFAQHGLPEQIVTDNGTNFTSEEFKMFCQLNGIKHKLTEPYNPQKNGEAERFVQTLKRSLGKQETDEGNVQAHVDRFLPLTVRRMKLLQCC